MEKLHSTTLILILIFSSSTLGQLSQAAKNGCTPAACGRCGFSTTNVETKVCVDCFRKQIVVDSEKFSECSGSPTIAKCLVSRIEKDQPQCVSCEEGYRLVTDSGAGTTSCTVIEDTSNCLRFEQSGENLNCTKCKSGFAISEGNCEEVAKESLINKCNSHAKNGETYQCIECEANHFETTAGCQNDSVKALCVDGDYLKEGELETCGTCAVHRGFFAINIISVSRGARQVCQRGGSAGNFGFWILLGCFVLALVILILLIRYLKNKDTSTSNIESSYLEPN